MALKGTTIRETLENADSDLDVMDQFKLELHEDEVFVFTPKGDLYKLAKGATVLDFAFTIHSKWGERHYHLYEHTQFPLPDNYYDAFRF